jgi:hypothetical protein
MKFALHPFASPCPSFGKCMIPAKRSDPPLFDYFLSFPAKNSILVRPDFMYKSPLLVYLSLVSKPVSVKT